VQVQPTTHRHCAIGYRMPDFLLHMNIHFMFSQYKTLWYNLSNFENCGRAAEMEDQTSLDLNFNIWILIGDLHHKMLQIRQHEVKKYNIPIRQLNIIRLIDELGPRARLVEIAKLLHRKSDVISRQSVSMEKDGFIKRIKETPKSRLLTLELTDKGREMLKINKYSDGMNLSLSDFTLEERQELHSVLSRMYTKLK
jgi:DNA-binding MarR family transcriptional regulator